MTMQLRIISTIGGLCLLSLLASNAQANTISVIDEAGNPLAPGAGSQYTASCDPAASVCMQGFLELDTVVGNINVGLDPTVTNPGPDGQATGYAFFGNPTAELNFLNSLLTDIGAPTVSFVNKDDTAGDEFSTNRQYFSIKQAQFTTYFKNTSGGAVTVQFDPTDYSHYTEYGTVVPIPAAAWLFGSALLGVFGIGVRGRAKAGLQA